MGQGHLGRARRALSALVRAAGFAPAGFFAQAGELLHALANRSVADRLVEVAAVVLLLAMLAAVFLGVVFRAARTSRSPGPTSSRNIFSSGPPSSAG